MYNLFYWKWDAKLMCTFDKYEDCKKALDTLKAKYPQADIWMKKVETISSFQEWSDKFDQKIEDYKDLKQ